MEAIVNTLENDKKFKIISDLHLDILLTKKMSKGYTFSEASIECYASIIYPVLSNREGADYLIIAGDLSPSIYAKRVISLIKSALKGYEKVFFVLGNHDYWYSSFKGAVERYKKLFKEAKLDNVIVLQNECYDINEDWQIVGTTQWYGNLNPIDEFRITKYLNDYSCIYADETNFKRKIVYENFKQEYLKSIDFIREVIGNKKTILVTHHANSDKLKENLTIKYENHNGYICPLPEDIASHENLLALIHGHSHNDKSIIYPNEFEKPIFSSTFGYVGYEVLNKKPLTFTLQQLENWDMTKFETQGS